jgi:hypothetical protein
MKYDLACSTVIIKEFTIISNIYWYECRTISYIRRAGAAQTVETVTRTLIAQEHWLSLSLHPMLHQLSVAKTYDDNKDPIINVTKSYVIVDYNDYNDALTCLVKVSSHLGHDQMQQRMIFDHVMVYYPRLGARWYFECDRDHIPLLDVYVRCMLSMWLP